ncbi:uncharacterized protein LOC112048620 [Bicyclus anynana]|uniref:Uncharacterized protein LOC112048620 n=1 Tax=Bicyclus anynana TaxID=110368 RepID=A0ABM3LIR5_BICAN|nr:uncharacterized protein LOC112048620 [Bicyclus anynana]
MKKVIVSKKVCCTTDEKSFSTGVIKRSNSSQVSAGKKTAKSDVIFGPKVLHTATLDYCKKCGDVPSKTKFGVNDIHHIQSLSKHSSLYNISVGHTSSSKSLIKNNKPNNCEIKPLQQYYRNDKFYQSTDSFNANDNIKKNSRASLHTIDENSENVSSRNPNIFQLYPENYEEEIGFMDPEDPENVERLKLFRRNNYFECHSVKSRINSNISLKNHKCVYRFYLNDRLFPVPLNTDYQETIRCIECQLPLDKNCENSIINGTVQAKVKLNGQVQDMMLMLPVKNSLIVKERRKVLPVKNDYDSIYFGIIKLDLKGDSKFNRNLPSDSLALRYQKGYKELSVNKKYEYDSVGKDDIIII